MSRIARKGIRVTAESARSVDVLLTDNDIPNEYGPVAVTSDLSIEFLPMRERQLVLHSCLPSFFPLTSQRGSYAFVRRNPPAREWDSDWDSKWDIDNLIRTALALSRLVRPTSAGTEYTATIENSDSNTRISRLGPINAFSSRAYIDPKADDWLTEADAQQTAVLYEQYEKVKNSLPNRVRYALWAHESAACQYYVDEKWLLVTQGLEALIHTSRRRSTDQFVERVRALAGELGVSLSQQQGDDAYNIRSELVHLGKPIPFTESNSGLYASIERTLRSAIRKAIEDDAFRVIFVDDNAINQKWPLIAPKNKNHP